MQICKTKRNFDTISFKLYEVMDKKLNPKEEQIQAKHLKEVESFYVESNERWENSKMFNLKKGTYLVLPYRTSNLNTEFILRIFTESSKNMK